MAKHKQLWDIYRFPGFYPKRKTSGVFGDPQARVIPLKRRGKKRFVEPVGLSNVPSTTGKSAGFETYLAGIFGSIWTWRSAGSFVAGARR